MENLNVSLHPITRHNWKECIELDVRVDQQELVGANVKSLAEASVRPESTTLGIFNKGKMVGFMMYLKSLDDGYYYIHRFMIDARYQKKGIGYVALNQTINQISQLEDCGEMIRILFLTFNEDAERLYRKIGFKDTGKIVIDEKLFYYKLEDKS